jgi:hypothetical protein
MRGYGDYLRGEHFHGGLRGSFHGARIEVVVGEESTQVLDDLVPTLLYRSKGIRPIGVSGVNADECFGVSLPEPG